MFKIFGREPALFLGGVAGVIQLLSLFLPLSTTQQGVLNAVAVAIVGFVLAKAVAADKAAAALIGVAKALIALGLAFGLKLSPEAQVGIMTAVTAFLSYAARQSVVAPLDENGDKRLQGPAISGTYVDATSGPLDELRSQGVTVHERPAPFDDSKQGAGPGNDY
jgi:hypothetical protein